MEQLAVQPFLSGLTNMDNIPVQYTGMALDALMRNQQSQDTVLADLQRAHQFNLQEDPLKLQHQALINKGTELNNAGTDLLNQEKTYTLADMMRKDELARSSFTEQHDAQLQKLLTEAGAERAKRFEQEIFDQLQRTKPGTPEHQRLLGAARSTRGWLMEEQKHKHAIEVARINAAAQLQKEQMGIDAGKYNRQHLSLTLEDRLLKAKTASERRQLLIDAANIAEQGGDKGFATQLRTRANDLALVQQSERELDAQRRGQQGQPDLNRLTNGAIPTVQPPPTVPATPQTNTAAPAPPASASIPQKPQLSGKRISVRDPNGNEGTIPVEQLQEALRRGFKEIK